MITTVADRSHVAEVRRLAGDFCRRAGFPASRDGAVALVVTELATNLVKHGGGGQMMVNRFGDATGSGIEVVALDRGRGMDDVERCLRDGYSTAGSPGTGLGAIVRQADQCDVFSRPGLGTAIVARFVTGPPLYRSTKLGQAVAEYPGESVCGDQWGVGEAASGPTIVVADGSGHGPEAHRAASLAVETFRTHLERDCVTIVERIHHALMPTRGAAVAVARVDVAARCVRFVGVGNISAALVVDGEQRHMVSNNGTAGYTAPRIREFEYPFTGAPLLILHSDGLSARWTLAAYPGLAVQHPSLIAGVLLRDQRRGRDDATVVALRAAP